MNFTTQTYTDMVRLLSEHPEWRVELRSLLLPEAEHDLLLSVSVLAESQRRTENRMERVESAIERLAEAQRRTESRLERVEAAVEALAEAQRRTESRLDRVEAAIDRLVEAQQQTGEQLKRIAEVLTRHTNQIGKLRGWHLEYEYRTKAYGYFGRILRRTQLVDYNEMLDELEPHVSPGELEDIALIDLIVSGRPRTRPDLTEVWLAVEVSGVIDREDINRARRRAGLLQKTGHLTIPIVAGEDITQGAQDELSYHPVVLMQNGRIEYWEQALEMLAPLQRDV